MRDLKELLALIPEPLGQVVLCRDKPYELTCDVPQPVGSKWIGKWSKLARFVFEFAREMFPSVLTEEGFSAEVEFEVSDEESLMRIFDTLNKYFDQDEFRDEILPMVLGLDFPDGRQYIKQFVGDQDAMAAFMPAAMMIISGTESREDVQAAKKKSPAAAEAEEKAA
jgi:hypothetical protein